MGLLRLSRRLKQRHPFLWWLANPLIVLVALLLIGLGLAMYRLGQLGEGLLGWLGVDTWDMDRE